VAILALAFRHPEEETHMSILTDLLSGKITFSQAATEVEQWGEKVLGLAGANSAASSDVASAVSDLKQAASNAVALGDTALGGLIAVGAPLVEGAFNGVVTKALGGTIAGQLTPAVDSSIDDIASALKAEIDAAALAIRAKLATPVPVSPPAPPAPIGATPQV
jgi:hypothetical protein